MINRVARLLPALLLMVGSALSGAPPTTGPSKVAFTDDGIATVNGKRFFPLGIYLYELNADVMADLHEHRFNTVVGGGFRADQMDLLHRRGMMAIPVATQEFVSSAASHPSLLGWYLLDEPESGKTVAEVLGAYRALKAQDPHHPVGLVHAMFEALAIFRDCRDFTMSDVYPVTAARDAGLWEVGVHLDEARRVHGDGGARWPFIQVFGGAETDGGKWAQPLPHEVRCMTFIALAHRATGILYFSYWPRAAQTWASVAQLNRDVERIVPWLIAPDGRESEARSSDSAVHVRARRVNEGWLIIAVNVQPAYVDTTIEVKDLGAAQLSLPYESRTVTASAGAIAERFAPYEAKVYLAGDEPRWP